MGRDSTLPVCTAHMCTVYSQWYSPNKVKQTQPDNAGRRLVARSMVVGLSAMPCLPSGSQLQSMHRNAASVTCSRRRCVDSCLGVWRVYIAMGRLRTTTRAKRRDRRRHPRRRPRPVRRVRGVRRNRRRAARRVRRCQRLARRAAALRRRREQPERCPGVCLLHRELRRDACDYHTHIWTQRVCRCGRHLTVHKLIYNPQRPNHLIPTYTNTHTHMATTMSYTTHTTQCNTRQSKPSDSQGTLSWCCQLACCGILVMWRALYRGVCGL